jgi:hypothetical protein
MLTGRFCGKDCLLKKGISTIGIFTNRPASFFVTLIYDFSISRTPAANHAG